MMLGSFCRWIVLGTLATGVVLAASSSVSLSVSPNPATYGSPVTVTATVSPGDATGKITFYDGVTVLGIADVSSGTASFVTRMLPSGARSLKAYYSGNGSYSASTSVPVVENIHTVSGKGFVLAHPPVLTGFPLQSIATGDFNGDGNIDLAMSYGGVGIALGHGDGTFSTPVYYAAGGLPRGIAVGDFNGDGILDLAATIGSIKIVFILLGVGDGSFGTWYGSFVPGPTECLATNSLATGDFNRDGKIDLAVGTECSVGIMLGVGNGSFTMGQSYQSGSGTQQTLVQDLDGDGIADLILGANGQSVTLLGHGDGTFGTAQFLNFGGPVIAGDFNGDGKIDIARGDSSGAVVLPGNGDGTFGDLISGTNSLTGLNLAAEDFNSDGKLDLAGRSFNDLVAQFGAGDGTFQDGFLGPSGNDSEDRLIVADFNGDGRPDMASPRLLVVLGAPFTGLDVTKTHSGDFHQGQTGATYSIGVKNLGPQATSGIVTITDTLPLGLTATSITGTGWNCALVGLICTRNDALAVNASYPSITVAVDVATWAPPKVTNRAAVALGSAPPGDYANDVTSIAVGQAITFGPLQNRALSNSPFQVTATASSGLSVTFSASGQCTLSQSTVTLTAAGGCSITASQSGNGTYPPAPDVVRGFSIFSASSSVALSSSLNPSRLSSQITLTATVTPSNASGTVTFYDGTTVLGIKNISGGSAALTLKFLPAGNRVLHAHYSGDGNFPGSNSGTLVQAVRSLSSPGLFVDYTDSSAIPMQSDGVAMGDFNGDGRLDVVTTVKGFAPVILLNEGGGIYSTMGSGVPLALSNAPSIRVGDVNGDGKADLVIADCLLGAPTSKIIVLLGNGNGSFTISQIYAADPKDLELADFNDDGKLDIVYTRYSADRFIILAGNGDGTFSQAGDFAANHAGASVAVGDFNGDGHADVVTSSASGVDVSLGQGNLTFDPAVTFSSGQAPFTIAVGDLNGDGKPDLATADSYSIGILLNNGNGAFAAPIVYSLPSQTPNYLAIADFNGDGRIDLAIGGHPFSDPSVFLYLGNGDGTLVSTSSYTVDPSSTSPILAAGDLDGDGRMDLVVGGLRITILRGLAIPDKVAIFRPSLYMAVAQDVNGNIAWDQNIDKATFFGATGDKMIYGDWDGSGTTKVGIFRPSAGMFALDINGNGAYDPGIDTFGFFGQPGDVPIVGDWNGDGRTKIGIYRPTTGLFALDYNGNLAFDAGTDKAHAYGLVGDTPIIGDWTGDGKAKIGIFRNGFWSLDSNNDLTVNAGDATGTFGQIGDTPFVGDWNGDGRTKVGLYRSSAGLFAVDYNGNLAWDDAFDRSGAFGSPGSIPVVGDWDGTGVDRIGVFFGVNYWGLDVNGNLVWDAGVKFGGFGDAALDTPVVGKWQ